MNIGSTFYEKHESDESCVKENVQAKSMSKQKLWSPLFC